MKVFIFQETPLLLQFVLAKLNCCAGGGAPAAGGGDDDPSAGDGRADEKTEGREL